MTIRETIPDKPGKLCGLIKSRPEGASLAVYRTANSNPTTSMPGASHSPQRRNELRHPSEPLSFLSGISTLCPTK
jgi:hypothetical protein